MPTTAHPAASRIPKPSRVPAVLADPDDLADLVWADGYRPNGIKDYIDTDAPVLDLRVHTFDDSTLVTLQWQHVAFDALGLQYVLEAWGAMLWGHCGPDDVPTPHGGQAGSGGSDPLWRDIRATSTSYNRGAARSCRQEDRHCRYRQVGLGYGIDVALRAKDNRMLRAVAVGKGQDPEKVFMTDNDIITTFILRCVVAASSMHPDKLVCADSSQVCLLRYISLRLQQVQAWDKSSVLNGSIREDHLRSSVKGNVLEGPNGLIPPSGRHPYVGNAFVWAHVLVRAGDVTSKPLSWLAREVRHAINTHGTRAQHEAYYALVKT
ncbi:hypothetical protein INS49_000135 [Diaporthe citri]|uniref:uncharacterized protein n=1 Tax=Diaporthe citri TaxID=83186 RepID=UPI001C80455B|nr:uncharacterized protein INS49_000135 [Diaporthe citri]KAG6365959.1 hypothetical protein INS49_000135 [Diaporthe citri]